VPARLGWLPRTGPGEDGCRKFPRLASAGVAGAEYAAAFGPGCLVRGAGAMVEPGGSALRAAPGPAGAPGTFRQAAAAGPCPYRGNVTGPAPAGPQPAPGPRRPNRLLPLPDPGPRRQVHRCLRRDFRWRGRDDGQDPAAEPARTVMPRDGYAPREPSAPTGCPFTANGTCDQSSASTPPITTGTPRTSPASNDHPARTVKSAHRWTWQSSDAKCSTV